MANNQKKPARATKKGPSGLKLIYLILYNLFSAVAWGTVLWRTVAINAQSGPYAVFPGIGEWTRWTQTVAGLEILHSLLGMATPLSQLNLPFRSKAQKIREAPVSSLFLLT